LVNQPCTKRVKLRGVKECLGARKVLREDDAEIHKHRWGVSGGGGGARRRERNEPTRVFRCSENFEYGSSFMGGSTAMREKWEPEGKKVEGETIRKEPSFAARAYVDRTRWYNYQIAT